MKNNETAKNEAQGAETAKKIEERKVQMPISMLKELAGNDKLLTKFIDIVEKEGEKSPMAYAMAKREIKQLELEVK